MAGTYTEGTSKVLSGVYTLIKAAVEAASIGARGIVAYPFTSNWGPVNTLTTVLLGGEYKTLYNASGTVLTASKVYLHAFKVPPQRLLAYRMATSAAVKGTVTLNDAGSAKSLELETLYPSDRAFTAVVKDGTAGGKVVDIVENSVKLLTVEGTTLADLIAKLNVSDYVRVKSSGANLPANTAGVAFSGGNNGSAVTATEYAAFLDVLEADGTPSAFSLDGVSDDTILATVRTWVKRVRGEGFYVTFVQGGPIGWDTDITAANAASKVANHRGIVNVGNGVDSHTAADMAVFMAARVASVALNRTLTDEPIDYSTVNKKLKPGERVVAKEAGTVVFIQDGDAILIDEGVNTLTIPSGDEVVDMGKIRINNALDQIAKDLEAFGVAYKRTRSNTTEARTTYASAVETTYLQPMARMEVIRDGYYYREDPEYHGKDAVFKPKLDEAFFHADITPVDSMERIYQKLGVNF